MNRGRRSRRSESVNIPELVPEERGPAVEGARDSVTDLIHTVSFNYRTGNYKDIVFSLREVLEGFDPEKCVTEMEQYFGVVISDGSSVEKRLITILRKLDAYLFAFDNKNLYQLASEDAASKPKLVFRGSSFIGFDENYMDSLLASTKIGFYSFRDAVDKVINEHQDNPLKEVLFGWRKPLVVLMIMLSEAARFHPVFDLIFDLWVHNMDKKLPVGLITFIKNWSHMSSVAREEKPDNGIKPPRIINLFDGPQATDMKDSKLGCIKAVAFKHRGKKGK